MSKLLKNAVRPNRSIRREPAPCDYSDEISEEKLEEIRKVAASKDKKDEQWEIIDGPAW